MGHPSRVVGLFPYFCQSNDLQIGITASHTPQPRDTEPKDNAPPPVRHFEPNPLMEVPEVQNAKSAFPLLTVLGNIVRGFAC